MEFEKMILATITMKKENVSGGQAVFICDSKQEVQEVAFKLEAILDGICHQLSETTYIIVKH